ncbi:hypothetical protein AB0J40_22870 [Amycolatopsis sp. NPDC049691]|uniref:hypothetical protein n=1 Tax=Amycolatopsis sp. NPDC049691 TaxID=3155155 RepID=UPI00341E569A
MTEFARRAGERVKAWFSANADHVTLKFYPEPDAEPLVPGDGYVRLWLAEGFLAKAVSWGNKHFPALHGGVTLTFANQLTPFTRFTKPAATLAAPGAYIDYPMTPLLPFAGGTVEVEAALYQASVAGPLAAAVAIGGSIASLIGPPLSVAAAIADKVGTGLDTVLATQDEKPVLGLHHTLIAAGGGGQVLRGGHLVVVNAPESEVPASLRVAEGRLRTDAGLLTGFDYLVVRVECRTQHDELRFPNLAELEQRAAYEWQMGNADRYREIRAQAVAEALGSPDLIARDRTVVARYVAGRFDALKEFGAVPGEEGGFDPIPAHLLPGQDEVANLTLDDLLRD